MAVINPVAEFKSHGYNLQPLIKAKITASKIGQSGTNFDITCAPGNHINRSYVGVDRKYSIISEEPRKILDKGAGGKDKFLLKSDGEVYNNIHKNIYNK